MSEPTKVSSEDLSEALSGLEPGWYRTSDIHPRYVEWAKRRGKEPAGVKALGESIRRILKPRHKTTKGLSVWYLDHDIVTGRAWFTSASPPLTSEGQADGGAQMSSGTVS
jgi:hypothetical protein